MKFTVRDDGKRLFLVCLGALIFSFNMISFVRAGNLLPGGIAGITVLIQQIGREYFHVSIPYSVGNLLLNSIPIFIGIRFVGKKFTLYSCLMIVLSSILTDVLPVQPITYDELLVAVFGGLINGFSIGLCLLGKASSGGLDIVAVFLSRKWNIDAWNYTLMLNAVILVTAGLIFGWDRALYSIIFQFTSTQVVHLLYQKHRQHTLLIVTNHSREVYTTISQYTSHGATVFRGIGSYDGQERDMVYSVVSSDEVKMVLKKVREVDPAAFINTLRTDYMTGRFIQKKED